MKKGKNFQIKRKYLKNLELDLHQIVWNLTSQVPRGYVTTYGAIAKALGDIRAARAVGVIEHVNPRPIIVPCHRVVYSDGGLGGYGSPEGVNKKIELLSREGIKVKDSKIMNFQDVLFDDFSLGPGDPPLEILRAEQQEMRNEINLEDQIPFEEIRTVAGVDASYDGELGFGAIVMLNIHTHEVLETQTAKIKTRFPYIPTYLSYHELPIAVNLLNKLTKMPDIIIFDGNGVLHPYGLGLATHAGIILQHPTIGIAKKKLCGELRNPINSRKTIFEIVLENNLIGYGLKPTSAKKRFVYVSPGNRISFETSLEIAKTICKTRIAEPIQIAHSLALELRKKEKKKEKKKKKIGVLT